MRRACLLLFLLIAPPCWGQTGTPSTLLADTVAAALDFTAPRTLEPVGIPALAGWGLQGLTALDPSLQTEVTRDAIRLSVPGRVVYVHARPPPDAAEDWGQAVAAVAQRAGAASDAVQAAGTAGIVRSFFEEMFNHLDPYSRYVPPQRAEVDRTQMDGQAGPGFEVARQDEDWVVRVVLPGSPAAAAGLRPGERLLEVDGRPVRGLDRTQLDDLLNGEEGAPVTLALRGRDGRRRTLELERVIVLPDTVAASRLGDLLVLRITSFGRDTDGEVADALTRGFAGPRRPRGLLLDLRGNRGGLLRQSATVAGLLLDGGRVAATAGRFAQANHVFDADPNDLSGGRPIVVLVDGRTASAAEIVAAALADQHRAVVVGSSTLGKGLVQTKTRLPDGGDLFVTWSRVLAPGGWPIQGLGVLPQLCTSRGAEEVQAQMRGLLQGQPPMALALARHHAARAPLPNAAVVALRAACPAAEGRDADVAAARWLIDHPAAYEAALIGPPPR